MSFPDVPSKTAMLLAVEDEGPTTSPSCPFDATRSQSACGGSCEVVVLARYVLPLCWTPSPSS
jgi:hypothetical protein